MDAARVRDVDDELVEVRARRGCAARPPRRAPPPALSRGPRRAPRRRAARGGRSSRCRRSRRARAAPGWCRCCSRPSRGGCPARVRAWSSRTRACRPGPPSGRRAGPGSGGRARRVHATMPRYGPPYWSGMPSGCPSPAAMSAPYSPGGASTASDTGSMTLTNRAPAACARRPTSGMSSSRPRMLGCATTTPATGWSASASRRPSASRSVVPASGPSATSGISSATSVAPSAYVSSVCR